MSATVASGRVFDAFLGPDLSERTLYHGHSYSGNALAAAVALRHLELIDAYDVLANVRARSDELRGLLDDRIVSLPEVADVRLRGLMGGVELAPPDGRPALGPPGLRRGGRTRRAAPPARRRRRAHAAADRHVRGDPPDRPRADRGDRRGHRLRGRGDVEPGPACRAWDGLGRTRRPGRSASAGQWRAPVDFDAAGPEGKLAPDGRAVVAFASNDYLGLTQHPAVIEAAHAAHRPLGDRFRRGAA